MMKASSRRFTTPTGRPVPAAHPLKEGSAPGYGKGGYQAPGPQKSGGGKVVPYVISPLSLFHFECPQADNISTNVAS